MYGPGVASGRWDRHEIQQTYSLSNHLVVASIVLFPGDRVECFGKVTDVGCREKLHYDESGVVPAEDVEDFRNMDVAAGIRLALLAQPVAGEPLHICLGLLLGPTELDKHHGALRGVGEEWAIEPPSPLAEFVFGHGQGELPRRRVWVHGGVIHFLGLQC